MNTNKIKKRVGWSLGYFRDQPLPPINNPLEKLLVKKTISSSFPISLKEILDVLPQGISPESIHLKINGYQILIFHHSISKGFKTAYQKYEKKLKKWEQERIEWKRWVEQEELNLQIQKAKKLLLSQGITQISAN
jgi:hypothetical protein